jgi:hypothetical protein
MQNPNSPFVRASKIVLRSERIRSPQVNPHAGGLFGVIEGLIRSRSGVQLATSLHLMFICSIMRSRVVAQFVSSECYS